MESHLRPTRRSHRCFHLTLHGSEGGFLSCFIDSNVVCQHLARGIKLHANLRVILEIRRVTTSLSAVQAMYSLIVQIDIRTTTVFT